MNPNESKPTKMEATPIKKPAKSTIIQWIDQGVACSYVKFQNPVSAADRMEPVYEFKIISPDLKYRVDAITWTPHGLIFAAHSRVTIVALSNVAYARTIA